MKMLNEDANYASTSINFLTHWPLGVGDFNKILGNFQANLVNGGWGIFYGIALRWMSMELTDDKSTLVQVMAWCWLGAGNKPLPEPMLTQIYVAI